MRRRKTRLIWVYLLSDYLSALAAWLILFVFRKAFIEKVPVSVAIFLRDKNFLLGIAILPFAWLLLHYITGTYTDIYRKSRLNELAKTFIVSLAGVTIIFFAFLLDDLINKYSDYYATFLALFFSQFFLTYTGRYLVLWYAKRNLARGRFGFNTIIIGSNKEAAEIYEELTSYPFSLGYRFLGYVELNGSSPNLLTRSLACLGRLNDIEQIIHQYSVEEVIIAIETSEHQKINEIIHRLSGHYVYIKLIPDLYDILSGTARIHHVIGTAFIEIPPTVLSEWEIITKRWFDVCFSLLALVVFALPMLLIALLIKATSKGSAFYVQERIGQFGKPFKIIKFRTMYADAEKNGPRLSSDDDDRITPIGKFLRKYRIDELPQFINVLKGDMSIVGPRAERKYFAEQILRIAPHYKIVWKVKPGITSLGMVKYGYASTVEQMTKRLKYDILYIENMGLLLDLKVLIYTFITVISGKGK
ncbi:MAG: sugar transferase [Chitinophagales bacterium]|nr:sugar transferase [Chitinophagales bacterium]